MENEVSIGSEGHWLNKDILGFNLIYKILITEVLNIFIENPNRLALLPVGVNCEKRGFLAGLTN